MTRLGRPATFAILALIGFAGALRGQSDTVQGTATVGAAKIVLASGMAVSYTAPNGTLISVLLSDNPPDRQEFATDTRAGAGEPLVAGLFEGAWKSQHFGKKFSGITFSLDDKGSIIGDEFLVGGRNNTFSLSSGEYAIELKSKSPRLVGRIRTKSPLVDAGAVKVGLDATFDLAVETIRPR